MSLFHGPPVTIEYRAEDIKKTLRPDWPLARCQEELMAVEPFLRVKLQEVALKMLNAMLSPDGAVSVEHIPALCPDCIGELAIPENRDRNIAKEIAKAVRFEVVINGTPVAMQCNTYTVQRWNAVQELHPASHVLVFPYPNTHKDRLGFTIADLQDSERNLAGNWVLPSGHELHLHCEARS